MRRLALLSTVLFAALPLVAQTGPPADGGATEVLQSIYIPPLTNAPFTLTLATEWVKPLGTDGNTVTAVNERKIARNRAGRIYEERVLLLPRGMDIPNRTTYLQLTDPSTHTWLNCSVHRRVCHTFPYSPSTTPPELTNGTVKFTGAAQVRTNLGKDILNGIEVVGMRVTTTIDAGQFGNAKPVVTVREFWYAPTLGINLRSTRDDPRSGKQTFTVTKISRDEPDPAL